MKTWTLCYNHSASLSEYIRTFWILFFHLNFFLLFSLIPNSTLRSDSILVSFLRSQKSLSQRRYPLTMSYSRIVEDKKKRNNKEREKSDRCYPENTSMKELLAGMTFRYARQQFVVSQCRRLERTMKFLKKSRLLGSLIGFYGKRNNAFWLLVYSYSSVFLSHPVPSFSAHKV